MRSCIIVIYIYNNHDTTLHRLQHLKYTLCLYNRYIYITTMITTQHLHRLQHLKYTLCLPLHTSPSRRPAHYWWLWGAIGGSFKGRVKGESGTSGEGTLPPMVHPASPLSSRMRRTRRHTRTPSDGSLRRRPSDPQIRNALFRDRASRYIYSNK